MQCLRCVAPLMKYFVEGDDLANINPLSSYGGVVAKEVGAALKAMITVRRGPISLISLKNKVGELHHQFLGCKQHDSHEFLVFLLTWLHEDLMGGGLSTLRSSGCLSQVYSLEQPTGECSAISLLFQGEYGHTIICGSCHYESESQEPFTVLSLSIPSSGKCTLTNLIEKFFRNCSIEYCCPVCAKNGPSIRRTLIKKLPPNLMIHLNHFEYNTSARKKQNYVDFPLEQLNLSDQASKDISVSYNLCAVLNHYGSMNSGHYI